MTNREGKRKGRRRTNASNRKPRCLARNSMSLSRGLFAEPPRSIFFHLPMPAYYAHGARGRSKSTWIENHELRMLISTRKVFLFSAQAVRPCWKSVCPVLANYCARLLVLKKKNPQHGNVFLTCRIVTPPGTFSSGRVFSVTNFTSLVDHWLSLHSDRSLRARFRMSKIPLAPTFSSIRLSRCLCGILVSQGGFSPLNRRRRLQ